MNNNKYIPDQAVKLLKGKKNIGKQLTVNLNSPPKGTSQQDLDIRLLIKSVL